MGQYDVTINGSFRTIDSIKVKINQTPRKRSYKNKGKVEKMEDSRPKKLPG
jgi:hypothetical protein